MRTNTAQALTPEISISQLEKAFATFNQVSTDLGSQYKELESKVTVLSQELAATRTARLQELTEKEELAAKLSALMAALPGGVIALDALGIIREENPAAIEILGQSYYGNSWLQALEHSGASGMVFNGEMSLPNDRRISISRSSYGNDGEKIILLTDVSEGYRLNAQINRDQRLSALGEMAARLAHQVRTPLSTAILYISHLSSATSKDEKSSSIIVKILNRLRQIERLVEGMLSYIRDGINDCEDFCLKALIEEINTSVDLQMKNVDGQLEIHCPKYDCIVNGSREALFNALSNLIDNSIQAVPTQPKIKIELNHHQSNYHITVSDNGPGIDSAIRERVFDPFFSTRSTGTGLGLAVVLSAVKAHNGEVFIAGNENEGTQFHLSIPDSQNVHNDRSGFLGINSQHNLSVQNRT